MPVDALYSLPLAKAVAGLDPRRRLCYAVPGNEGVGVVNNCPHFLMNVV